MHQSSPVPGEGNTLSLSSPKHTFGQVMIIETKRRCMFAKTGSGQITDEGRFRVFVFCCAGIRERDLTGAHGGGGAGGKPLFRELGAPPPTTKLTANTQTYKTEDAAKYDGRRAHMKQPPSNGI